MNLDPSKFVALVLLATVAALSIASVSHPSDDPRRASTASESDVPQGIVELGSSSLLRPIVVARATRDWRELGVDVDPSRVRVYRDTATDQLLATTVGVTIRTSSAVTTGSSAVVRAQFSADVEDGANPGGLNPTFQGSPTWTFYQNHCASQYSGAMGSWISECYQAKKLLNDGDPNYDYFSFHLYATSGSSGTGFMDWVDIMSEPNHGFGYPTQHWVDWDPPSDWTGNCSSYTVTVTYLVGVPLTFTRCESWAITIYQTAAKFKQRWDGFTQSARSTAFATLTKVAQGQSPSWFWGFQYRVCHPQLGCTVEP